MQRDINLKKGERINSTPQNHYIHLNLMKTQINRNRFAYLIVNFHCTEKKT